MKKIIIALFILSVIVPFSAQAKDRKQRRARNDTPAKAMEWSPSNEPTLACVAEGRRVTITVSGDLSSLRVGLSLPENGTKICMVSSGRTAGSAKVADRLDLCRDDRRDSKRKLVFGPMPILGRSFDRFALRFLVGDQEYFMHGTHSFKVVGPCRFIEDTGGFAITANPNDVPNKRTR